MQYLQLCISKFTFLWQYLTSSPALLFLEQNLTSQPQLAGQTPEDTSTDIVSSYLLCSTGSSTPDTVSIPSFPPPSNSPNSSNTNNLSAGKSPSQQPLLGPDSSQLLSTDPGKASTKDLSGGKAPSQQPMYPFPGVMGPGVPGVLPPGVMCIPIHVGFVQGGQSLMLPLPTLDGTGQHAFMHHSGMMSFPGPMMQNIPCPPPLPTGDGGPTGNPLTMTYSNTGHPTLDSRNIPANQQGPSPPSSDESKTGWKSAAVSLLFLCRFHALSVFVLQCFLVCFFPCVLDYSFDAPSSAEVHICSL